MVTRGRWGMLTGAGQLREPVYDACAHLRLWGAMFSPSARKRRDEARLLELANSKAVQVVATMFTHTSTY